jgi:hypothetical protein
VVIFAAFIAGYLLSKDRALGPDASSYFAAFFAASAGTSVNTLILFCSHLE